MTAPDPQSAGTLPSSTMGHMAHAGAMLREAREAAGLTLDMVSQQLKLAPRQVRALEDGDYALLPGRTFVRGFARNYARLVHLDPQLVLDALPGATPEGGLESPPLHPTAITMGELPSAAKGRPRWVLWAIPVLLVAIVAGTFAYQRWRGTAPREAAAVAPPAAAPRTAPPAAPAPPATQDPPSTPLPNPVVGAPLEAPPEPGKATPPGAFNVLPDAAPEKATSGKAAATAAEASNIAPLSFALRAPSWLEVKDGSGRTLISQTVAAGQTQSVVGTPPFDVVIGNARDVTLTLRGNAVDLAPFSRGNVARLTLK